MNEKHVFISTSYKHVFEAYFFMNEKHVFISTSQKYAFEAYFF